MKLEREAILQAIIEHSGYCDDFAGPAVCKRCPLGNKRVDGKRVNCMDYLNISEEMSNEEVASKYEQAAEEELFAIELEDILKEP